MFVRPLETGAVRLELRERENPKFYQQVNFIIVDEKPNLPAIPASIQSPPQWKKFKFNERVFIDLGIPVGKRREFEVTINKDGEVCFEAMLSTEESSLYYLPDSEGEYQINVTDLSLIDAEPLTVSFFVDPMPTTPPPFKFYKSEILTPKNGQTYEVGEPVHFEFFANTNNKPRHLRVKFNDEPAIRLSTDRPFTHFTPTKSGTQTITITEPAHSEFDETIIKFFAENFEPQIDTNFKVDLTTKGKKILKFGESITFEATVEDKEDFDQILFFVNGNLEKTVAKAPFVFEYEPRETGSHGVVAQANKRGRMQGKSDPIYLEVFEDQKYNYCMNFPEWQAEVAYKKGERESTHASVTLSFMP